MAYTKTGNWADNSAGATPITAAKLNAIENGLVAAAAAADVAITAVATQATETAFGVVTLATNADVNAGTSTTDVVTPAGLKQTLSLVAQTNAYADLSGAPIVPTTSAPLNYSFGGSGPTIPGTSPNLIAVWLARDTWANLSSAQWLKFNNGYMAAITANPTWAAAIGTPLIPHDMDKSGANWNTLLDQVSSGASVTVGSSTQTTDQVMYSMGATMSDYSPAAGTVYARLWWEMNMAPIATNIDRTKFIAAWRRAVPQIRQGFADRAAANGRTAQKILIDFSPLSDGADYTAFYPGDDVVDSITMDVYANKYGTTIPTPAALTASVAAYLNSIASFAITHNKPVGLGEWGNWQKGTAGATGSHGLADFPDYIDQVFNWMAAQPKQAYLSYYNLSDDTGITMADTPNSLAAYQARTSGSVGLPYMATLDPNTKTLMDNQVPARLSVTSLNAAYGERTINRQTASYAAVATDSKQLIEFDSTSAATFTVPTNASIPFPLGTVLQFVQWNVGQITVAGASGVTLRTLTGGLLSSARYARVTITQVTANEWLVTGDLTGSAAAGLTVSTAPAISGTATTGSLLTVSNGTWSATPDSYLYAWNRDGAAISGATSSTYTLVAADETHAITATVTAVKAGYTNGIATTASVTPTSTATATALTSTSTPTLDGRPQVGQTITTTQGGWSATPDSYTYQWKRAGVAISGATSVSYTIVSADVGNAIVCTITAIKSGYTNGTATSQTYTASAAQTILTSTETFSGTAGTDISRVAPNSWVTTANIGTVSLAQQAAGAVFTMGAAGSAQIEKLSGMTAGVDTDVSFTFTNPKLGYVGAVVMINTDDLSGLPSNLEFPKNGYVLRLSYSATGAGNAAYTLSRVLNSTLTQVAQNTYRSLSAGTVYGCRFQRVGNIIRYRVWDTAGAEPTGWSTNYVDSTPVPTGKVRIGADITSGASTTSGTLTIDNVVVVTSTY